ncbi:hypothetical protein MTO96_045552 [Rhipicephalus appendiculatus]
MKLLVCLLQALYVYSYRIREFVDTKELVWTHTTTKTSGGICKRDLMRYIRPTFIRFNRTVLHNGHSRITKDIRGGVQHSSCRSDVYHVRR